MPEAKQKFSDDYIRRSEEDNWNSRTISPGIPAKNEVPQNHVTNLPYFVDPQGPRALGRSTENIMNAEELRQHCAKAFQEVGAPEDYSKFFADVVQTENDIDSNIHNIHQKLSPEHENSAEPEYLLKTIQELTKGYNGWKTEIDVLSQRSRDLPPLKVDSNRIKNSPSIKALCSIKTKELNVSPGDEMKILDTTKPNKLKVRTNCGDEGYIPALSCLLPSPDKNAITAPDRLKLQLLASWRDSMNKSKTSLVKCLVETAKQLNQEWKNKTSIHSTGAKERVSRRLRRLTESLNTELPNWDLTKLHNSLFSIEKELCSWNGIGSEKLEELSPSETNEINRHIEPIINVIASLDKTVLCYQMFRKQWYLYRRSLEQCPRPMRIVDRMDQLRTVKHCKNFRYYEVKVTREEVETVEEIVETRKPKSTVQAEQMTTSSAEERRRFVITGVIDPRSGEEISFQDAINARIIDQSRGMYLNPNTGGGMSIPEAMNEGRIKVGSSTAEITKEKTKAVGLITIKSRVEHRHMTIKEVTDAVSGKIMTLDEAKKAGIIDETNTHYTMSNTGERVDLEKAIQGGWVTVDSETSVTQPEYETKTYAVNAVVDQVNKKKVPFAEAVNLGLIDKDTGNYVNNVTGEKVYVTEAIKRGFLKAHEVDSADGLNIDMDNKVVVERMEKIRRNVLKSMGVIKAFKMGKKPSGEPTSPDPKIPEPVENKMAEQQEAQPQINATPHQPATGSHETEADRKIEERLTEEIAQKSKSIPVSQREQTPPENHVETQNTESSPFSASQEEQNTTAIDSQTNEKDRELTNGEQSEKTVEKEETEAAISPTQNADRQTEINGNQPDVDDTTDQVDSKPQLEESKQSEVVQIESEDTKPKSEEPVSERESKENDKERLLLLKKGKPENTSTPQKAEAPASPSKQPETPKQQAQVNGAAKETKDSKKLSKAEAKAAAKAEAKAEAAKAEAAKPEATKAETSKQDNSPQKKKKDKKKSWWKRKK